MKKHLNDKLEQRHRTSTTINYLYHKEKFRRINHRSDQENKKHQYEELLINNKLSNDKKDNRLLYSTSKNVDNKQIYKKTKLTSKFNFSPLKRINKTDKHIHSSVFL